ncbi:hypothetical protein EJB05_00523, partial [Eragrostis curvula]
MDGNSSGGPPSWLGYDPNAGRGHGGATAAPSSGPRSGRGAAVVGGGTAGAAVSGPATAADGGHFFTSTASPTLGNHGRTSTSSPMGGFSLNFSNSWDAGSGASLIPPFVRSQGWKESDKEETNESIDEDKDDADRPLPRPIGQKKAKKMTYEGKSTKSATEVIELDKFEKIQSDAHENRLKVLEMQQKLSAEKVESSKINQLAAKEQKEARKLELEARMMETFTLLSKQDKGKMSDEEKAEHVLTLKCLRKRLFPEIVD